MFKEKKWSNRIQLILLFVIFLAPLVGAYYAYSTRDSRVYSTVNNGEFYSPVRDLADVSFIDSDGQITSFNNFEKRWYIVVVADGICAQECEQALNKISRVRAMNGKNLHRIVAVLAHTNLSETRASELVEKYHITGISTQNSEEFATWLEPFYKGRKQESFDSQRIYMIDPLKKLMMSYSMDVEPKGLYKDLKRLLKVSQVG